MHRAVILATLSLLAAAPVAAVEVPRGRPLAADERLIDLVAAGVLEVPLVRGLDAVDTLYVDAHGALTLGQTLPGALAPRPLGEVGGVLLIAPLWRAVGWPCAAGTVEEIRAEDTLTFTWATAADDGCLADEALFAVELRRRAGGGMWVTFLYETLPPSEPGSQPRAGVAVGEGIELFPDGPDAPSDRAKALLAHGSERVSVEDRAAGDPRALGAVKAPGVWVFEVDGRGALVGDDDGDGVRGGDNCEGVANPFQFNLDGDERGDACDGDDDGDTIRDFADNCPLRSNPDQRDHDRDGVGDLCEDADGDGLYDLEDRCPFGPDPADLDLDGDGVGDACDRDIDGDDPVGLFAVGAFRAPDLCPFLAEDVRLDGDRDGIGDGCDLSRANKCKGLACLYQRDSDGDGVADPWDLCPTIPHQGPADEDGDRIGDACDGDGDGDGVLDVYLRQDD